MKLTVEFRCDSCGLLTPGTVELPDDVDARRKLTLGSECYHCHAPLSVTARVEDFIRRDWDHPGTPPP